MRRIVTLAALLAAGPALAQHAPTPDKDGVVRITLTVSPGVEPVPVSKLGIYPDYRDQQPGNRVQGLMRTFFEQNNFFYGNKEAIEKRNNWTSAALADLPADMRQQAGIGVGLAYDDGYTRFLGIADKAARFSRIEWNEYFDIRKDGINFLLPEIQSMRSLAAVISLRMRGEVKAGEWQRAAESAKTLVGIAQALEQHPTVIGNLVGIAIFQIAMKGVEEMVAQPGCPSLHWALADVPAKPVDARHGLSGERVFLMAQFQGLLDAKRPLSEAELAPYLAAVRELAGVADNNLKEENPQLAKMRASPGGWFAAVVADPAKLQAAQKRIVGRGPFANFRDMPAAQVGLLNDLLLYEELRDDLFKWFNLPHWQAMPGMRAANEAISARSSESVVAPMFIATVIKVKSAETRLAQRTALLRAVEAVRLHLAATGKLPATLAETGLPEPIDPVTGKPFSYTLADGFATLRGENSSELPTKFIVEYTIRVRK